MKKAIILIVIIIAAVSVYKWKPAPTPGTTYQTPNVATTTLKTYTDPQGVFSFSYPPEFQASGREGAQLAKVTVPRSYQPQTNFSEAVLTINWSNKPEDIKSCSGTATSSEAAAGNRYDTTTHKKIFDGDCYTFEYIIHSTNIGNYDPSQGIKEFDQAKVKGALEGIINSFKYLVNSN